MSKPSTADGYSPSQTAHVRAICLDMATKLGDLMDEIVVVGGLVGGARRHPPDGPVRAGAGMAG